MDTPQPSRRLSEISHLFLSSVRQRQLQGQELPRRTPPRRPVAASIDLTPEEFAAVVGERRSDEGRVGPVRAVLAWHLGDKQAQQVHRYARCLAMDGQRIGLIHLDAAEFRLTSFDLQHEAPAAPGAAEAESFDLRAMSEAMAEMSCEVDRWIVLIANPRLPEARALLKQVPHWVLLTTCDHDGVIAAYRALKGLADLQRPRLSLAVVDAQDAAQASQVAAKLGGVCAQFLKWSVESHEVVHDAAETAQHLVMDCRPAKDKAQLATSAHWQAAAELIARAQAEPAPAAESIAPAMALRPEAEAPPADSVPADVIGIQAPRLVEPAVPHAAAAAVAQPRAALPEALGEVVDLPGDRADEDAVLSAVLHGAGPDLVECPVRPPMCPSARLAVSRERRLTLVAVQRRGNESLRAIAQSLRWMNENRQLISMALPQFSVDAHQAPHLRLLVDQNELNAELLRPILQTGSVSVQTYRRLRWGERMGLLLEAA
jgi:hypothetical protein